MKPPFQHIFRDGAQFPPPRTHLSEPLSSVVEPRNPDCAANLENTDLLLERPAKLAPLPVKDVGLLDRRMVRLLRPGSTILIDTSLRRIEDAQWSNEYDRRMYFVEIRNGYQCGWFQKDKTRLIMQPHTYRGARQKRGVRRKRRRSWDK